MIFEHTHKKKLFEKSSDEVEVFVILHILHLGIWIVYDTYKLHDMDNTKLSFLSLLLLVMYYTSPDWYLISPLRASGAWASSCRAIIFPVVDPASALICCSHPMYVCCRARTGLADSQHQQTFPAAEVLWVDYCVSVFFSLSFHTCNL